ncbi:hypothetical protein RB195_011685 [Necator americanus]|uniref:C2H2-type domain-containing protein n=1 Tax=Necator americanus TaxID=51031 RepID=A0ABR1D6S8_NECAM
MVSFVVVRVSDGEPIRKLTEVLNDLALPYNICSEDNLKVPGGPSSSCESDEPKSVRVIQATGTAEVVPSGNEINIATLLQHHSNSDMDSKAFNELWMQPGGSQCMIQPDGSLSVSPFPFFGSSRPRVPNNIKRYRRQICKMCGSSNLVPFLRSKMVHAATHSDFKRYKCPHCDKRGVSVATITLHIKSRHPGQPHNEYFDEMNEEEYVKLLLLTEKCFDNPYM